MSQIFQSLKQHFAKGPPSETSFPWETMMGQKGEQASLWILGSKGTAWLGFMSMKRAHHIYEEKTVEAWKTQKWEWSQEMSQ